MLQRGFANKQLTKISKNEYVRRIHKARTLLKKHGKSALVVSSAPAVIRSRDTYYHYRQNSDFYYFTGSKEKNAALLISTENEKPILFMLPQNPDLVVWEGSALNPKTIAKKINAVCITTTKVQKELINELRGVETLFYQSIPDSISLNLAKELMELASHTRRDLPRSFAHCDQVMEVLRLIKSREEVRLVTQAAKITDQALRDVLPMIKAGTRERDISSTLTFSFNLNDAEPSFPNIVASGPSAATLHYEKLSRSLKANDLLLIDCGAEYGMYAADITRTLPVSGRFEGIHLDLYEIVLEAQLAALNRIKPGASMQALQKAAAKVITQGLIDLKVLKGSLNTLLEKKAYFPYFPHGIGHSLGLDVHDLSPHRDKRDAKLKAGMVLTIEPGIYFTTPKRRIPSCGIRIEDDVLVTKNGYRILTPDFPKEPEEVEELFLSI